MGNGASRRPPKKKGGKGKKLRLSEIGDPTNIVKVPKKDHPPKIKNPTPPPTLPTPPPPPKKKSYTKKGKI
eukprot:CAMPEP_0171530400 /NCGR_PEP_ID=MMETSP0959-20130129/13057_1 /TAXON_ID=87120 /ORGANISM="Aurantiochytrium limacinum, Strain ATCCMYA-1381" /LENGTH=70 /DNA_ID=CAMNT_0012073189 /DNA_START=26 /DNA_END=236 /DNA_ORIENTATION=-